MDYNGGSLNCLDHNCQFLNIVSDQSLRLSALNNKVRTVIQQINIDLKGFLKRLVYFSTYLLGCDLSSQNPSCMVKLGAHGCYVFAAVKQLLRRTNLFSSHQ